MLVFSPLEQFEVFILYAITTGDIVFHIYHFFFKIFYFFIQIFVSFYRKFFYFTDTSFTDQWVYCKIWKATDSALLALLGYDKIKSRFYLCCTEPFFNSDWVFEGKDHSGIWYSRPELFAENYSLPQVNHFALFWDWSITTITVYMFIIAVIWFLVKSVVFNDFGFLFPTTLQYLVEMSYFFILDLIKQQVGKEGKEFFPILFVTFIFIVSSNFLGMLPYSFTITSHIFQTFGMSFSFFLALTFIGFWKQKLHYLNLFVPSGLPAALMPLMVTIEIISYLSRAVSLGVRLFANVMSGHTLLNILSSFVLTLNKKNFFLALIPLGIVTIIVFLEFAIAFIQAYVFVVLLCIYLSDSYHAGH